MLASWLAWLDCTAFTKIRITWLEKLLLDDFISWYYAPVCTLAVCKDGWILSLAQVEQYSSFAQLS